MHIPDDKIIVLFVSTGRCGTKRLREILHDHLASKQVCVQHQVGISRLANVLGNFMYHLWALESLKERLFKIAMRPCRKSTHYVSTDPLISMIIPKKILNRNNTHIIHITRDDHSFAQSMYKLTRNRKASFIAHNFIPLWQPFLWPFENLIRGRKIMKKYQWVSHRKNIWFRTQYGTNQKFTSFEKDRIFEKGEISLLVRRIFDVEVEIPAWELKMKANESRPGT